MYDPVTSPSRGEDAQRALWDHYDRNDPAVFSGARYRHAWLVRRLPRGASVLDIGVGDGGFERLAMARGLVPYGLDPSPGAVARLQAILPGPDRAKVGTCTEIPWSDATFDAVVMSEVLEHIEPSLVPACLREVARVLKPGGRLLGTVPAREDLAASQVFCPHCGTTFHRWGHRQAFDVGSLRSLLAHSFSNHHVAERAFFAWNQLNWKGRIIACCQIAVRALGSAGGNATIVFDVQVAVRGSP